MAFIIMNGGVKVDKFPMPLNISDKHTIVQSIKELILKEQSFSILLVDIDDFSRINDEYGFKVGNQYLEKLGVTIQSIAPNKISVGGMGGDKFCVIYPHHDLNRNISIIATKIQNLVNTGFEVNNTIIKTTCSIGISIFPLHGINVNELLSKANNAIYRAKLNGKNGFYIWTSSDNCNHDIRNNLSQAINNGGLYVEYQPQINILTNKINRMEALLRWKSPIYGQVSPLTFIPIAESSGLIHELGDFVFRESCKANALLHSMGYKDNTISVNISPVQLMSERLLISKLKSILSETEVDPNYMELEITESGLIEDPERVAQCLTELKSLGLSIAIDDFGTGYSALAYLQEFPIDYLKLDRMFTENKSEKSDIIVSAIISLAKELGIGIIAEGVEYKSQEESLINRGCFIMQGYLYSRPLGIEKLLDYLETWGK